MKVFIPTIGTRGDVQPYVALGVGFRRAGHDVTIATMDDFEPLITANGLRHATVRGRFLEATKPDAPKLSLRDIGKSAKQDAPAALLDQWEAAQGADLVVYNPAAWGGFHIADKLDVPAFAAFPTPLYSPTAEYPSPFLPLPDIRPLNKLTHRLYMKTGPAMFRGPIKQWRRDVLGLPPGKDEWRRNGRPVTKLYGYSPAVVPQPKDWDESTVVTGYWFLDSTTDWEPPAALQAFLDDGPPPVCVGFGSMIRGATAPADPRAAAREKAAIVIEALLKSRTRGILLTGWGGLDLADVPPEVYVADAVPHDWLFPRVAAVVHHGGAGTTGAGLRAGKPTVICPFITDQHFWGQRVERLGVGPAAIPQRKLTADKLAAALEQTRDEGMIQRAEALGAIIRQEDGVGNAVRYVLEQVTARPVAEQTS